MPYEPKIVAYLCTWCSYTGADTAGIARLNSPANIRAIRVPCSGRVSPEIIMRTFDQGADGVLVLACHIGECHYESGNHRTAKRLPVLQSLLAYAGLEPERLRLDWVSASEGERYARITSEFTEAVRALGPARWRNATRGLPHIIENPPATYEPSYISHRSPPDQEAIQARIRQTAANLMAQGEVNYVLGYETGPRGRVRPAILRQPEHTERLVWNSDCTHNLAVYLPDLLAPGKYPQGSTRVAMVAKPCDTRAVQVQINERRYDRQQVHVIAVACEGVRAGAGSEPYAPAASYPLQARCQTCTDRQPVLADSELGVFANPQASQPRHDPLQDASPAERLEFWLAEFDRCLRCYACRQACPACDCPTCLYERDDSLWTGMGVGLNEKRAFHLGRAYHLAGRCVGCDECTRACPVDIPIGLLNRHLAAEMQRIFGYTPGRLTTPPPFVTVLSGEERLP